MTEYDLLDLQEFVEVIPFSVEELSKEDFPLEQLLRVKVKNCGSALLDLHVNDKSEADTPEWRLQICDVSVNFCESEDFDITTYNRLEAEKQLDLLGKDRLETYRHVS